MGDVLSLGLAGAKFLKLWTFKSEGSDGILKGSNTVMGKREHWNYTDHCWAPEDKLIACSDTNDILIFDQVTSCKGPRSVLLRYVRATAAVELWCLQGEFKSSMNGFVNKGTVPVSLVVPFSRGFIAAGAEGLMSVFERADEKDSFMLIKTFEAGVQLASLWLQTHAAASYGASRRNRNFCERGGVAFGGLSCL